MIRQQEASDLVTDSAVLLSPIGSKKTSVIYVKFTLKTKQLKMWWIISTSIFMYPSNNNRIILSIGDSMIYDMKNICNQATINP